MSMRGRAAEASEAHQKQRRAGRPRPCFDRNIVALQDYKDATGFNSVTALSVDDGWTKISFFDISAVVIDHEFADDPRAKEFGEHYVTVLLDANALPEQVALELVEQFGKGSEFVQ